MERELEKHPQKDGIITQYKCGFICVGGWSSRIEKWEEFIDSPIGKYILSCESEINRLKEENEKLKKPTGYHDVEKYYINDQDSSDLIRDKH